MIRWTRIAFALGALLIVSGCGSEGSSPLSPDVQLSRSSDGVSSAGATGDFTTTSTSGAQPVGSDSTGIAGGPMTGGN